MKNKPLVSVIIVSYDGLEFLGDCLNSLKEVDFGNFEIILVDNNSHDDSLKFVKENFPEIIVIELDDNYGFAQPNNIGVENAKGDFLLFLNNDTKVTPNFISEMVKVMETDCSIAICQSLLVTTDGKIDSSGDYIDSIGIPYSSHKKINKVSEIFSAKAASMLMRKSVFKELGGFDEKFFVSFEDIDLSWRARILGYKIIIVPSSIVYHLGSKTTEKISEVMAFHGFKNQLAMKITNFETKEMIKSLILFFLIYGMRSIRVWLDYAIKGKTNIYATKYEEKFFQKPDYESIIKGTLWVIKNYKYILKKQKLVNSTRKLSTKKLIKFK